MAYGYPVTGPMEIPDEVSRSRWGPDDPELKELPGIEDAGLTGIRLQNTEVRALPGMPVVDIGTGAREREAAEYARDLGIATDRFKQVENFNRRKAQWKTQQQEKASKTFSKGALAQGRNRSNWNRAKSRSTAWRSR